MALAKDFIFRTSVGEYRAVFKADEEYLGEKGCYRVYSAYDEDLSGQSARWSEAEIKACLGANWTLVKVLEDTSKALPEPSYNGEDAEGNPKNFTKADLQIGMRVRTANGGMWVVMQGVQKDDDQGDDELVLVYDGGWTDFRTDDQGESYMKDYVAVEVYNPPPYNFQLLNVSEKGGTIWKACDPANAGKKKALQEQIEALQAQLAQLN